MLFFEPRRGRNQRKPRNISAETVVFFFRLMYNFVQIRPCIFSMNVSDHMTGDRVNEEG